MNYGRFIAMVVTATVVMYGLMYLNTYEVDHIFFSQTRMWMALLMGAVMAIVMLIFKWRMYPSRSANLAIVASSIIVSTASLWLVRSQETVYDDDYMRAMIPHHTIAILTSTNAHIRDPRVRQLADSIIEAQVLEIAEMKQLIKDLEQNPVAANAADLPPLNSDQIGTTTSTD